MKQSKNNLLTALQEAKEKGFCIDYFLNEKGQFACLSNEAVNPRIIEIIPCLSCSATLYLIADNGKQGTYVHHWEL